MSLVRIVDPLGDAIAWFAPDAGGACVGYAVRQLTPQGTRWVQILTSAGRDVGQVDAGCHVLTTPPGPHRWALVERDPTAARMETIIDGVTELEGSFKLRLALTAWLEDASLSITLSAINEGPRSVAYGAGIRSTIATETLVTNPLPNRLVLQPDGEDRMFRIGHIQNSAVELRPGEGVGSIVWHGYPENTKVSVDLLGHASPATPQPLGPGERLDMTSTIGFLSASIPAGG